MSVTDSSAAVVMTENRNELPASPSASFERITVIQPSGRWAAFNFQEIWYYRDLLWALAARDIKLRYKQTALGIFWVVFQPLMAAGLFSIIFGGIAKFPSGAVPYFVFAFAGQLGWQAFQSTLTKASSSLVGNAQLVSKVYFPRLVLPLSTMFSTLIDFGIAFALMLLLMLVFRVPVHLSILLLPVWIVLILLLAVGTGLYTGALMVSYRDIQYVLPVLLQFGVYAAPVAFGLNYAIGRFPAIKWFLLVNPLSSLLEGLRWSLVGGPAPSLGSVLYSVVACLTVFLAGSVAFRNMERRFADVI